MSPITSPPQVEWDRKRVSGQPSDARPRASRRQAANHHRLQTCEDDLQPQTRPPTYLRTCPTSSADRRTEGVTHEQAEAQMDARIATMLPAELIQPGEIIILLLKPSPLFIVLAPLGTLAALVILTAAAVWVNDALHFFGRQDLILIGAALVGLRLFWQFLEWLSRVYVLTDRRMIRVQGVWHVSIVEARLHQIQHTYANFSIRERLFALGTIAFATAGTAFVEAAWQMVAHPLEVHQKVVQTIHRYRGR